MRLISFILTVICLLPLAAGCSCPATSPAPAPEPAPVPSPPPMPAPPPQPEPDSSDALQLASKFCPRIYLKGDPEAKENFQPDPVQLMIELSLLRDIGNPAFTEKPTVSDLLRWFQSDYYLDVADLDPEEDSIDAYKTAYDAIKENHKPTVYARVTEGRDYTIVQYWLFYYFNDWRNVHEGDWELVQLHFPRQPAEELLANDELPVFTAYSQHQAGQRMSWSAMEEMGLISGTHPAVYVAQGSHANYFTPGQFWSGLDFDDTGLASWRIIDPQQMDVVLLTETDAASQVHEWLEFQGYWGEYLGFSVSVLGLKFGQRGPFGPQWSEDGEKSKRWAQLEEWVTGLPEYPKPFWTSFLSLPGDWAKLAVFSIFSPANLHVYDSSGNHVGLDEDGKLEKTIPGALFITPEGTDYQTILVPDADVKDEYTVVADGTGSGFADIKVQIPDAANKAKRHLEFISVPITSTTALRATIKPEILAEVPVIYDNRSVTFRDKNTILQVDTDGDSIFEIESAPGTFSQRQATTISPPTTIPDDEPSAATRSDVRINRIFYEGLENKAESDEYVEIQNWGNEPVDMTGWIIINFTQKYPSFKFPAYVIEPGKTIRVYTNETHQEWGGFSFSYKEPIWSNIKPDTAALYNAQGQEISRRSY